MIWPVVPLKRVALINEQVLAETTDPDFRFRYVDVSGVSEGQIAVPDTDISFLAAPSRARRIAGAGDVLVSTVRTYLRAVSSVPVSDEQLVFSTGLAVLQARPCVYPRFLGYACRSLNFLQDVEARSTGVSYPAISPTELVNVNVPVPPMEHQRRIADFLDARVKKILQMLAHKADQLRLLEEREQAMLDHVLVDTSPRVPLRRLTKIQTGVTVDGGRTGAHLVYRPYLRVANVKADRLDLADVKEIAVAPQDAATATLRPGDVLMTEGGDLDKLGRGTLWRGEIPACIHQNHVFAVRPDSRLSGEYLALMTRTSLARAYFESTGSRTTNLASTNTSKIASFPVPLPAFGAQVAMVKEAAAALEASATLRAHVEQHRDLLRERQQALITAAVTGEIDVTTARRVA